MDSLRTSTLQNEPFSQDEDWRKLALKVIDKLSEVGTSFWFNHSGEVWRIGEDLPEHPQLDLSIIRLKLLHHMYRDPD